jgi:hypothetical protein
VFPFSDRARAALRHPGPPRAPAGAKEFFVAGLDLGQAADPTALAVNHVTEAPDPASGGRLVKHHAIRHLQRWPLGTSYIDICADVALVADQVPDLQLGVDATGVGRGVVDIFRKAQLPVKQLVPITITGGHEVSRGERGGWNVPKKDLVGVVSAGLQSRRLKIAEALPEAATLRKEQQLFRAKITTAGNETLEAWRERDHDDEVLAVAIAVWLAGRPQFRLDVL